MIRRPPRSTLFPYTRSSDLFRGDAVQAALGIPVGGGRVAVDRAEVPLPVDQRVAQDRKSTRLNSSHLGISYAVFCLKKKRINTHDRLATLEEPSTIANVAAI